MTLKPIKIQNWDGTKRFGVVCTSLDNLLAKAQSKLGLKTRLNRIRLMTVEDGAEISDDGYLQTLEPQTVIVALEPSQTWKPIHSHLKDILESLLESQKLQSELAIAVQNDPSIRHLLWNVVSGVDEKRVHKDTKAEDPEWFYGLDRKYVSKDAVMRSSAARRIRGYLRLVQEFTNGTSESKVKKELQAIVSHFKDELQKFKYYESYFARSAANSKQECFCKEDGEFECEGAHNEEFCERSHTINPYGSRDARIVFSTWNLDHQIEKSREILPALCEAISQKKSGQTLNWMYFYELLFTRSNLKLVHVVCHDKKLHSSCCDSGKFYSGLTTNTNVR